MSEPPHPAADPSREQIEKARQRAAEHKSAAISLADRLSNVEAEADRMRSTLQAIKRTFELDEADGYRSSSRTYALDMVRYGLGLTDKPACWLYRLGCALRGHAGVEGKWWPGLVVYKCARCGAAWICSTDQGDR